ncbi:MAG: ABC transporter ATP-binding protein [Chthoniobacterales bacterium]
MTRGKTKPPLLGVNDLRIERYGTEILRGISWSVKKGEHWVILGANGSGKTSLLSSIMGYFMPAGGDISLLGQSFGETDWRELRKRIGIVSSSVSQMMRDEETALESVVSGKFAMIDYWGKLKLADRRRAERILRFIEASHLAKRLWVFLSQGERQRVLIGRALMSDPKLLILDEPCAGLDPAAREAFLEFLQRLSERKAAPSMVLVTHHVEEIMPCFSHVLFLKNGEVIASGPKKETLTNKNLSAVFDGKATLVANGSRYHLRMKTSKKFAV